jgi:hypothetical protein
MIRKSGHRFFQRIMHKRKSSEPDPAGYFVPPFRAAGSVRANRTSGGGEDGGVVGTMPGDATDDRALDAAFRFGRDWRCDEGQRERKAWNNSLHVGLFTFPRANQHTVRSGHAGL